MPPRAPRPPSPTSLNAPYYSAYRGLVRAPDGSFHHFLRYVDPVHEQKGYWRFHTAEDERRAYACGLSTPEMVLLAVDGGDGPFKDVLLRWVPGKLDKNNKPSVGSAAAHLEAICGERRVLGKAMSFRGCVPTYPCSTDPELLKNRLLRYGLQKGNLEIAGFVEAHQQRNRIQEEAVRPTETRIGSGSNRPQSDHRDSSSASQNSFWGIPATPDTGARREPAVTRQPTVRGRLFQEPYLSIPTRYESSLYSTCSRTSRVPSFPLSSNTDPESSQETTRSFAESPEQEHGFVEFSKTNDLIPCIDCDEVGGHNWNCNIGKIKPLENLAASDYEQLVEAVKRFDPQPWTTHVGPPKEPEPVGLATQTKDMAQTIRLLDSYKDNTELHALPDGLMIFVWALKTTPGVEMMQGTDNGSYTVPTTL